MVVRRLQKGRRQRNSLRLSADASGIAVEVTTGEAKGEARIILWSQIDRIAAFKRDLYGRDLVCALIETSDRNVFELDEEMAGWAQTVNSLHTYLPSATPFPEWFLAVAFPAFKESPAIVFKRA